MTVQEMAEYIVNHDNWDGCDLNTLLEEYSDEYIQDLYEMVDKPEMWE